MKNKILSALTAGAVALQLAAPVASIFAAEIAVTEALRGDADGSGVIDSADLAVLRDFLISGEGGTAASSEGCDLNCDGITDSFDMALLRGIIAEKQACSMLYINEVCSSNKASYQDSAGAFPDWVELYNGSDSAVDLSGIGLSDGAKDKFKFVFPEGTEIGAGEYIIISCDDGVNQAEGEYHAAFKLSAAGETVYLTHPDFGEIDSLAVPPLDTDIAYGRYPDGSGSITYLSCTPAASNNTATDMNIVEMPVFSVDGGFYDSAFALALSDTNGNEILYTTDGSDPTVSDTAKTYTGEINIYNNTSDKNVYSAITDITLSDYSAPSENVDKGIIIRAVCRTADGRFSRVVTNGYFIGKTASYYSDFKVVSLSTDSDLLFDEDTGIYMVGSEYYNLVASGQFAPLSDTNDTANPTNYNKEGREYEIPMNVQVFENGELAYTEDVGARISGNWSRGYAQKSIRLYARSEYGGSSMKYEFIEGLTDVNGSKIDKYDKVTLRNGGTDQQLLHFKDLFIQRLCKDRAVDIQEGEPCIVFLEGEFWGFYFIREKQDADYIEAHYGIDKDNVTVLKNGALDEGSAQIAQDYRNFLDWAAAADMSDEANYAKVCETVDIQSFIDHITIETYINNADWATDYLNNIIMWRATEADSANAYADGKWRFMLYDLDFSADFFDDARSMPAFDSLNNLYTGASSYNFVPMFYNLLSNASFREQFYSSYIDIMKNNFDPSAVSDTIDEYVRTYGEAIKATKTRFDLEWVNGNYADETEQFRSYFISRRNIAKKYLDKLMGEEFEYKYGSNIVSDESTWSFYGDATASRSSNNFTITTNSKGANSWDIQSQSGEMKIEKGKMYEVSFKASCSTSSTLAANINHQVGNSWPSCFAKSGISLTPEPQEFSYIFTSSHDTASNWRLCFDYGLGKGVYTITDAQVREITFDAELVNELGDWQLYTETGEAEMTENSIDGVTVETIDLPDEAWQIQALYSGMTLEAGKTYTCSFTVKGDSARDINLHVQQNYGDYTAYLYETVSVGAEESTYTFSFTADENCLDGSICFDCGDALGKVELSDVSVICAY